MQDIEIVGKLVVNRRDMGNTTGKKNPQLA